MSDGKALCLVEVGPGAQPPCVHSPVPTQRGRRGPRAYFSKWGLQIVSYFKEGVRLANSRKIRKAPEAEESGWDFRVSLPCLPLPRSTQPAKELGSDPGPSGKWGHLMGWIVCEALVGPSP